MTLLVLLTFFIPFIQITETVNQSNDMFGLGALHNSGCGCCSHLQQISQIRLAHSVGNIRESIYLRETGQDTLIGNLRGYYPPVTLKRSVNCYFILFGSFDEFNKVISNML